MASGKQAIVGGHQRERTNVSKSMNLQPQYNGEQSSYFATFRRSDRDVLQSCENLYFKFCNDVTECTIPVFLVGCE